jgi:4-aminobutyrate aminotransferase-like enzyme
MLVSRCFTKGLLVLPAGASAVRFSPPLVVRKAQLDSALSIFGEALREVQHEGGTRR